MIPITAYVTDKGEYRSKNQDSVMCEQGMLGARSLLAACVCDGVGSLADSEIAAIMMCEGLHRWFHGILECYPIDIKEEEIVEDLELTLRELNEIIYEKARIEGKQMGCTLSVFFSVDSNYYLFQAGDSRIYSFDTGLVQLTTDDTLARQVNDSWKIMLSNYVGKGRVLEISVTKGCITKPRLFLIATDGGYRRLLEEDVLCMKRQRKQELLQKECRELIQRIRNRGERDNLSCVVLLYREDRGMKKKRMGFRKE